MKLKIKETGEILEDVKFIDTSLHKIIIQYLDDGVLRECLIKNLSDVEEVKDYEEPKGIVKVERSIVPTCVYIEYNTEEEAEKSVERLRAWKRLKHKGFRFIPEASYVEQTKETEESMMFIACTMNDYHDFIFGDNADIKLIFEGKER